MAHLCRLLAVVASEAVERVAGGVLTRQLYWCAGAGYAARYVGDGGAQTVRLLQKLDFLEVAQVGGTGRWLVGV